jgi:hypothetical protein
MTMVPTNFPLCTTCTSGSCKRCNLLQCECQCTSYKTLSYYRLRNCGIENTQTQKAQYQRQKIMQNTVRVPSSLYTMNVGSLSSYQNADNKYRVPWNQMSDRSEAHIQPHLTSSGSEYRGSSTRRTITRLQPGALVPGGAGVDIKHNSYERRLNRLKGRALLKSQVVPPNYGAPVPFNPAKPVYGGKTIKTGIVNGCEC